MGKIKKLGQSFVQKQEATAASQNEQNAKIDEIISNFTLETPDANDEFTIALPVYKEGNLCKITKIGSNLSVNSEHVLNSTTYELPAATTSTLGGVKIGSGLTVPASGNYKDKLSVNISEPIYIQDDGTLGIRTDSTLSVQTDPSDANKKQLHVTVEPGSGGKTYGATDPIKITTGISGSPDKIGLNYNTTDFDVEATSKDLKLKYRITGVNGPISKSSDNKLELNVVAPLKVPTTDTNKDKLTLDYSIEHGLNVVNNKLDINVASTSDFGVVKIGSGLTVNGGIISAQTGLQTSTDLYYYTYGSADEYEESSADVKQNGNFVFRKESAFTRVTFNANDKATFTLSGNKNLILYLPTDADSFSIEDRSGTSIVQYSNCEYKGTTVFKGALYRVIYYHTSNVANTYTVTKLTTN